MMAGRSTESSPLACWRAMSRAMKVPVRPTPALWGGKGDHIEGETTCTHITLSGETTSHVPIGENIPHYTWDMGKLLLHSVGEPQS